MVVFSDEELQRPVRVSVDKVRPYLIRDGGNIEIVGIKNMKVYVILEGACKSCPSSKLTLKNVVEGQLKMDIHPELEVICLENAQEFRGV
ncbi:NifU family protein [Helicobacter cetorum]|uniref:NifU family protein n=1 Tax=Helicobacter cetorum TaxID=138563 RepID=UPI000CF06D22|nr:NifU family protein [Helicobacter cetorum]